jgi:hypothetical protein
MILFLSQHFKKKLTYLMAFLLGEVVSVDPAGVGLGSRGLQVQTILLFVLLHLLAESQQSTSYEGKELTLAQL